MQALLCVCLGLEQDREEACVLLLVTRLQAVIGIHHIDLRVGVVEDDVSNRGSYPRLALASRDFHHLVLLMRDVRRSKGSRRELDLADGHPDLIVGLLNCIRGVGDLVFESFQGRIQVHDELVACFARVLLLEVLFQPFNHAIDLPLVQGRCRQFLPLRF